MANWPAGLPHPTAVSNPVVAGKDNAVRSPVEVGPAKVRARFTGTDKTYAFYMDLTPAQQAIFWPFFETTIKKWLPFDFTDLRTGAAQKYRFTKYPQEQYIAGPEGAIWQRVTIELETVY